METALNPLLDEIFRTGSVLSPAGERVSLHSNVSPEEGRFISELIASTKPAVTLEVGLAFGISALFICSALKAAGGSRHIVIDPCQAKDWQNIGICNLERAGFKDMVEFHEQPSHLALPELEERGVNVDFALIDGYHTFDHTLVDFFHVDRLLRPGGVLVIDDAWMPSISKVCRFIVTNRSYTVLDCLVDSPDPGRIRKHRLAAAVTRWSGFLKRVLKPEITEPDIELGLVPGSRCIAFRKDADDSRRWDFHRSF